MQLSDTPYSFPVAPRRFELRFTESKSVELPIVLKSNVRVFPRLSATTILRILSEIGSVDSLISLVWEGGFEPPYSRFQGELDKPDSYTPRNKKPRTFLNGVV